MSDVPDQKLTIRAAAAAVNQPERSLFRAVEKGIVPSTKQDGVTHVELADALAWAERRQMVADAASPPTATAMAAPASPALAPTAIVMRGSLPSAHVGSAGGGGRGFPGGLDGDLAATFFAAFRRGEGPSDLVESLRVLPAVVGAAYRQYLELESLTAGKTTLTDRFDHIEERLNALTADLNGLYTGWTLPMRQLSTRLDELRTQFAALSRKG